MSGGIAYVYDVKGKFADNRNMEMVELDPVADMWDALVLKQMIQKQFDNTGNTVAKFVLEDFENQLKKFCERYFQQIIKKYCCKNWRCKTKPLN